MLLADPRGAEVATGETPLKIQDGCDHPVDAASILVLAGESQVFPQFETASERVRALLDMNQAESRAPAPGSDFVIARLMELVLVEILRNRAHETGREQRGLLAGLADSLTAQALVLMHSDVAKP